MKKKSTFILKISDECAIPYDTVEKKLSESIVFSWKMMKSVEIINISECNNIYKEQIVDDLSSKFEVEKYKLNSYFQLIFNKIDRIYNLAKKTKRPFSDKIIFIKSKNKGTSVRVRSIKEILTGTIQRYLGVDLFTASKFAEIIIISNTIKCKDETNTDDNISNRMRPEDPRTRLNERRTNQARRARIALNRHDLSSKGLKKISTDRNSVSKKDRQLIICGPHGSGGGDDE